ncbi:MAG TPA: NAD(P)/FAD-dependent oxidoreductase [Anaeromyxobacteraceae bacterium]|nr:NAD(P)/FAD-dependent oxidoreductase [Anaeromyxobacteraceae bacterium]
MARNREERDADVIVVGSGVGGLTVAGVLARIYGKKVLVLERHYRAGGFTHTFSRPGGFAWDVGVHYVGEMGRPSMLRSALQVATGGRLRWSRMPEVFDRLVFPGFEFGIRAGRDNFRSDLRDAFPAERRSIDRYIRDVERAASWMAALAARSFASAPIAAVTSLLLARRGRLARRTTRSWLDEHVRDERLKAVLGARWGDYGLPPSQSAFFAHAVITAHYLEGAFYPVGTAARIAEGAQEVIKAAGGAVRIRAEVERILVSRGRVGGVRLSSGEELRAPMVISDAGARTTYLRLLGEDVSLPFRADLERIPNSMAHVSLYLGLSKSAGAIGVSGENYWLHDGLDHDRLWARSGELLEGRAPQTYVSFPSMKDPEARAHTAEIIAATDARRFEPWRGTRWMKRGPEYLALKERIADALLASAERRLPGLSGLVVHRELSTPLTTEHFTGHPGGEIYNLPVTPDRFERAWLGARTPVRGLYLTGADALFLGVGGAVGAGIMCAAAIAGSSVLGRVIAEAKRLPDPLVPPGESIAAAPFAA